MFSLSQAKTWTAALLLGAALLPVSLFARPKTPGPEDFAGLSQSQLTGRLGEIQKNFDQGESYARRWHTGWVGFYALALSSGLANVSRSEIEKARPEQVVFAQALFPNTSLSLYALAYNTTFIKVPNELKLYSGLTLGPEYLFFTGILDNRYDTARRIRGEKQRNIVRSWMSSLGLLIEALTPFEPASAPSILRRLPQNTPKEMREKLALAEIYQTRGAGRVLFNHSWKRQVMALLFGSITASVIVYGYKQEPEAGLTQLALSLAITELRIFTMPRAPLDNLRRYRKKYYPGKTARTVSPVQFHSIVPHPGGLVATWVF